MISVIDLTDGWLTEWRKEGGRFKEWVRHMELDAINHGWLRAIAAEPGRWLRRVLHVISWLPALWDDADWDQVHLYKIMQEKIRRMRVRHETARIIADWKKVAGQLREVEEALGRLISEDYCRNLKAEHRKKYGNRRGRRKVLPNGMVSYKMAPKAGERESLRKIYDAEEKAIRSDLRLVAKHLIKNSRTWWD